MGSPLMPLAWKKDQMIWHVQPRKHRCKAPHTASLRQPTHLLHITAETKSTGHLKSTKIEETEKIEVTGSCLYFPIWTLLSALVSLSSPHFIPNEQAHKKSPFDFSLLLSVASILGALLEDIRVYHLLGWAAVSDLQISFYIKDPFR